MKTTRLLIFLFILPLWLPAQETPLNRLYDKYHDRKGFDSEEFIPSEIEHGWMRELRSDELGEFKASIGTIRILALKQEGRISRDKYWTRLLAAVSQEEYTEVATLSGEKVRMMVYYLGSSTGTIREFALLFRGKDRVVMITATGDMDMSKLPVSSMVKTWHDLGMHLAKERLCRRSD